VERSSVEKITAIKLKEMNVREKGNLSWSGVEINKRYGKRVGIKYRKIWKGPFSKGQKRRVQMPDEEIV
jgi:hypothetical protein